MMATIYGLRCNETGEVYIGSTTDYKRRIREHKSNSKCSSIQIINRNNYEFYVIEETDIKNRYIRERYHIESNQCVNFQMPLRSSKDRKQKYNLDHPDRIKQYYLDNKEKILQQQREIIECECGSKIQRGKLFQHKKSMKHINLIKTKIV